MVSEVMQPAVARRWGYADNAQDLAVHDHVSWAYKHEAEWRDVLCAFFAEAPATQRLIYTSPADEETLWDDLTALPGRDDLVDSGRLVVVSHPLPSSRPRAAVRLVDEFTALIDDALSLDYEAVRVATRLSSYDFRQSEDLTEVAGFTAFELFVDRAISARPILALCGVDRRIRRGVLDAIQLVHPRRRAQPTPHCAAWLFSIDTEQWALAGEVDLSNREAAANGVASLRFEHVPHSFSTRDRHLDLRHLRFIDAAGIRSLFELARGIDPHDLVLHHPPTALKRILAANQSADNADIGSHRVR